jgi:hypothetical protein
VGYESWHERLPFGQPQAAASSFMEGIVGIFESLCAGALTSIAPLYGAFGRIMLRVGCKTEPYDCISAVNDEFLIPIMRKNESNMHKGYKLERIYAILSQPRI